MPTLHRTCPYKQESHFEQVRKEAATVFSAWLCNGKQALQRLREQHGLCGEASLQALEEIVENAKGVKGALKDMDGRVGDHTVEGKS